MHLKKLLPLILVCAHSSLATDLSDIENFREYSDLLASSGQPSTEELKLVADQGYERVVYLAFTDNDTAIEYEDSTVKGLDMAYVHLPIDFMNPTVDDFRAFVGIMQGDEDAKTLVHCQVNFRASTFSFLYRVIALDVPMLDAKEDLDSVWNPNEVWFRFTRAVLQSYGKTEMCEGCDWGEHEFLDQ